MRARLFQPTAEPHRRDAPRESAGIVGLDRERTQSRFPRRRLEARAGNLAQEPLSSPTWA